MTVSAIISLIMTMSAVISLNYIGPGKRIHQTIILLLYSKSCFIQIKGINDRDMELF